MFTGIIQAIGRIAAIESSGADRRYRIDARALDLSDVANGDSIAVGGVCLTALDIQDGCFSADVSVETLNLTTLGSAVVGDQVNLEKALRLVDRLGGHLVSGHIDATGEVISISNDARSQRWTLEVPQRIARYIAQKGSVCIDGVSLTVNEVDGARFGVNLIPHTQTVTTFGERRVGDSVNIEVDLIARYAERLATAGSDT
ncbi:MAG: riboflavin synthase [Dokdonella sp.]